MLVTTLPPALVLDEENARADALVADELDDADAGSPAHAGAGSADGWRSRPQPTSTAQATATRTRAVKAVCERAWLTGPPQWGHLNVRRGREWPQ